MRAEPSTLLDAALAYLAAGRSIVPIAPGMKAPSIVRPTRGESSEIRWHVYKKRRPTVAELRNWFGADTLMGVGIPCGPVSGIERDGVIYGLETLDIDDESTLADFLEAANWQGLSKLIQRLPHERSPRLGGHFPYLCNVWEGNLILARRDGTDAEGKPRPITLIETRGEGGQIIVAPTPPGIHPTHRDRGYVMVRGSWEAVPIITPAERHDLLELARSFNCYVASTQIQKERGGTQPGRKDRGGPRPGDDLNATADDAWWQALLEKHGWTVARQRDDITYWQRPAKEGKGWSATLGACGDFFYVFSTNATPFESDRAYSPFGAYAVLEHNGDFKAAAKKLAKTMAPRQQGARRRSRADRSDTLEEVLDTEDPDQLAATARADDQPGLHPEHNYRATPDGLVWTKRTKDGPQDILLTSFTATITADILEDDGVETRRHYEITAEREGVPRVAVIPASQFVKMDWIAEHLGPRAIVMAGMTLKEHSRAAIQLLSDTIASRHIYTHIGWRELQGGWAYLHGGGAITATGALAEVTVAPGATMAPYRLPPPPDREAAQAALLASLQILRVAPPDVVVPLYGAIWRSVLGTCDFSVYLLGLTGCGKSELAALLQQHWGITMDARHLPAAWSSTANALEQLAFQGKDAVLVIDDFCPRGSAGDVAQLHAKADRVLRAQGNRSGRSRLDRSGHARPAKPPRGLLVSTGEDLPLGQSLRARICVVEVTPTTVAWEHLSTCQAEAAAGHYATAMAAMVQWLAPQYGDVLASMPQALVALRAQAVHTTHRRTPELVANLALGWQYFLQCASDLGVLTETECQALWRWAWTTLSATAQAQQTHQRDDDPVPRFLALLRGALTSGDAHVQDGKTLQHPAEAQYWGWTTRELERDQDQWPPQGRRVWTPQGKCLGWLDDTLLYLQPDAAYSVAQRMADTQRSPLAITQRTLHTRLHEAGVLIRQPSQQQNTMVHKIGPEQRPVRAICLPIAALWPSEAATGQEAAAQTSSCHVPAVPAWRPTPRGAAASVTDSAASVTGSVTGLCAALSPQLVEKKGQILSLLKLLDFSTDTPPIRAWKTHHTHHRMGSHGSGMCTHRYARSYLYFQ
jgi:hypothetical protein